jgi:hypothetical protein
VKDTKEYVYHLECAHIIPHTKIKPNLQNQCRWVSRDRKSKLFQLNESYRKAGVMVIIHPQKRGHSNSSLLS